MCMWGSRCGGCNLTSLLSTCSIASVSPARRPGKSESMPHTPIPRRRQQYTLAHTHSSDSKTNVTIKSVGSAQSGPKQDWSPVGVVVFDEDAGGDEGGKLASAILCCCGSARRGRRRKPWSARLRFLSFLLFLGLALAAERTQDSFEKPHLNTFHASTTDRQRASPAPAPPQDETCACYTVCLGSTTLHT